MTCRLPGLFLVVCGTLAASTPHSCVGSVAVASFRFSVQPPAIEPRWLAVRSVNNISAGYRISYQPLDLPADIKKDARLTLVAVPKAADGQITVLEPRAAASSTEWTAPFALSIVVLVFAPQGLDEKRLANLVTKDQALVAQLAGYAEQTADVEAGIEAVTALDDLAEEDDARSPLRTTPAEQALFALVRALNPAASSYNPLGAGRRAGPTSIRGKAAGAFFDNAGGIVPGGGILPGVKSWLMPDTEFRAVFAQPAESDGMTLCAEWRQERPRNKQAYLWAHRLIGIGPPQISLRGETHLPIGLRANAPVKLAKSADWRVVDRIFDWRLIYGPTNSGVRVSVRPLYEEHALGVDLRKFVAGPGAYRLEGKWDWDTIRVSGSLELHSLSDWTGATLTPAAEERLVTGSGVVMADLAGSDFRFLERATFRRADGYHETALDLPGERAPLRLELDTDALRPGWYVLTLARVDGKTQEVPFRVLPPHPRIDNLPLRVSLGAGEQKVTLTGTGLDRLERLECERAEIRLAAGDDKRREATVVLRPSARAGDRLAVAAKVAGLKPLLSLAVALQVAGPKPRILETRRSLPRDLNVALREGELPAGSFASFALKVDASEGQPVITVQCSEPARTIQVEKLRAGEKHPAARLETADAGSLFLSLDPGAIGQSGFNLIALLETDALGKGDPFTLGRIVRLPRIESFYWTDEKSGEGYAGLLKGQDLETIERLGWDAHTGLAASELPRPITGEGQKQTLKVTLPWPSPSPKAPLYIWLRGESEGRATRVTP